MRDGGSPRARGSGPGAGSAARSDSPVQVARGQFHRLRGGGHPSTSPVQVARGQFHKRCCVFKGIPPLCKRYNACRTWYRCESGPRRAAPGHETRQWGRLAHIGAGKQPAPTHRYLPQCTATRPEAAPGTGHGPCEAEGPGMTGRPRQRPPPAGAPGGSEGRERGAGARARTRQENASGTRAQEPEHAKKTRAGRGRECPRPTALPTERGLSPPEGP